MIDRLKDLIDATESNPKLKSILLKIAALPEAQQDNALSLVKILIDKGGK